MLDLPGPLRLASAFPFVGRSAELERLRTLMPLATGEGRRVVLLGGEPGSGKSRIVREFAAEATAGGALVLYGACDAAVPIPYGPFAEALDHLARTMDPADLRAALGTAGGELTRLLPDLPSRVGELPPPTGADPDTERHRLHVAVTDLLAGLGRLRPVLLVLEDGHWADAPTLLLLRHLARAGGDARVLVLATFRDTEAGVPGPLADTLADLRRNEDVVRMRLPALTGDEVTDFVRYAAGSESGPELAGTISDLTAGNAFLVCELWRALIETDAVQVVEGALRFTRPVAELGTPESVREVVSQRLSRLSPRTSDLLELAATAGAEFELSTIRSAAGLAERELAAALEEAELAGMIEEVHARAVAYRFAHELVQRALYDRLSGLRRAELHLRVGEALEAGAARPGRAADLAHHFAAAAPLGEARRGIAYSVRAARAATDALAFEEAAERLRTAIELGIDDEAERGEVFLELGTACHRAGKALEAIDAFTEAAAIARAAGRAGLLARAAIGFEESCWRPGIADGGAVELLEEAASALAEEGMPPSAALLGGLARALDFRGDHEQGAGVRTAAIDIARRADDRAGLATVLVRSYWSRGTSSLADILGMLTEAKALGEELGDTEILAESMAWRVPAFVALCDIDAAREEVATLRETAERTAQPFMLHVAEHYGSSIALSDGRLEEAEARARSSREWSRLLTGRDASGVYGIQMFSIRREQGRLAELAPVIRILAAGGDRDGPWRPGLVSVLAELGMEREARHELDRLADDGLDAFRSSLWLASLTYITDACAVLGDERMAAIVYPELAPLSGANVMIGHLVSYYGAADRYLGMLAATLGEWEAGERHFEAAMELNRRMGATTWLARTAYEYGRMLTARGGAAERAAALLEQARGGGPALPDRVRALGAHPPESALPDGLSPREVQILLQVARGLSNREIGATLHISEHTAANHIRSILRKTGCANRTEAASYAHAHRLITT